MIHNLLYLMAVLLIPVILIYGVYPATQKVVPLHRVGQGFRSFDPTGLAPSIAPFFYQHVQTITGLGFDVIDYMTRDDASGNASSCMIYLVNRKTLERASIVGTYGYINGETRVSSHYFEFTTKFTDNSSISTNNLLSPGSFKTVAKFRTARVTWMDDPVALYDVHRFHVAKYAGDRQKMLPPRGQEVEAYEKAILDVWNTQVETGLATFDSLSQTYNRTLYGSYYMVWCILWPMKQIRLWQRRAYSQKLMREYEKERPRNTSVA